ncbi:MAG: hypothetical protein MI741_07360, partial [Rhodospirillales bacterium]|nr:hypothetical protein [Rhodospirillales bacterium]
MDHPSSTSIAGPTPPRQRIVAIDVLRGFALLGILVINIRAFAMVWDSYMIPDVLGPLSFTDHLTWWLGQLLAEM